MAGGGRPSGRRRTQTTRSILSYQSLAPLLAERVAIAETALYQDAFAARPLDEQLVLELHARLGRDLVPDWAGRWRDIEVSVGKLRPPLPHEVPQAMRNDASDLEARWRDAAAALSDLTLEYLAFAEGRFPTIHPFRDFNGRTIRLFLLEVLRRLDLPRVVLAPESAVDRSNYFAALEAADQSDWRPLMDIWRARFQRADTTP